MFKGALERRSARMLQNNRTDLMMTDNGVVAQLTAMSPNDYERAFTIKTDFKIGPGINKAMPELRQAIAEALSVLVADGTMAKLTAKYGFDSALLLPVEVWTK